MRDSGSDQLFLSRPLDRSKRYEFRVDDGAVAGVGVSFYQTKYAGVQHLSRVLRTLVLPRRLPHLQIELYAADSRSPADDYWFRLDDISVSVARAPDISLDRYHLRPRRNTSAAMAPSEGCEC